MWIDLRSSARVARTAADAHIVPKLADAVSDESAIRGKPLRIIIFPVIIRWRASIAGRVEPMVGIAPPG
jgi:hypothetical protein